MEAFKFKKDFEESREAGAPGPNDLLLYALGYYLDKESAQLKSEALTDGTGDQSADAVYFDLDNARAIIAQGYTSNRWFGNQGNPSKAASLDQAVNWLLIAPIESVPERIRKKAIEFRQLHSDKAIDSVELIYVHNAYESKVLKDELDVLAEANTKKFSDLKFTAFELGANEIEKLHLSATSLIAITEDIDIPYSGSLVREGTKDWAVAIAVVPGIAIYRLYDKYRDALFSANVRDFLGARKTSKINFLMHETAQERGPDFFVFNNGISLLTHKFSPIKKDGRDYLRLSGVSIINGAQSTGVLHAAGERACENIRLQCRILESDNQAVIEDAIRFNNTQNAVKASDRKSNDEVQKRLDRQFSNVGINYLWRRSLAISSRPGYKVEADAVAQALCSFIGSLTVATRNRLSIWDPGQYDRVFPKTIPWNNVWLVQLLTVAVDQVVAEVKKKGSSPDATASQKAQETLVGFSPSKQALIFLVGKLQEQIMGRAVRDKHAWCAKEETVTDKRDELVVAFTKVISRIISRVANARREEGATYQLVRSESQLDALLADLIPYFEETFDEADYISTVRQLTYIQAR